MATDSLAFAIHFSSPQYSQCQYPRLEYRCRSGLEHACKYRNDWKVSVVRRREKHRYSRWRFAVTFPSCDAQERRSPIIRAEAGGRNREDVGQKLCSAMESCAVLGGGGGTVALLKSA